MVLPTLREKNLAKIQVENNNKKLCAALPSRRERQKFEKTFEKVFESVKELFLKKPETRCSIDRKTGSIN